MIAPNGFITFDLTLSNQHFLISTKYKSSDKQIDFTLFDVSNKKVVLLMKQAYYPFDDSLVFVKKMQNISYREYILLNMMKKNTKYLFVKRKLN